MLPTHHLFLMQGPAGLTQVDVAVHTASYGVALIHTILAAKLLFLVSLLFLGLVHLEQFQETVGGKVGQQSAHPSLGKWVCLTALRANGSSLLARGGHQAVLAERMETRKHFRVFETVETNWASQLFVP